MPLRSTLRVHFPLVLALAGSLIAVPATTAYGQKVAHKKPAAHKKAAAKKAKPTRLLNGRHYTNSSGHRVHAPTRTSTNTAPAGATAACGDGTYSFSESHRGACSHHGGVARWL